MALIDRVQGLLDVDITLEPWSGQDEYGKGTYGASQTIRARVQQGNFDVVGSNSQAIVGQFKVILGENIQVDVRDRLTLPAAFGVRDSSGNFQTTQPIIRSATPVFYRGQHDHTVLICG